MPKYFAYGSNLSRTQMKKRCPDSAFIEVGRLRGRSLAFTIRSSHWDGGVADIVPDPAGEVWGVLYEISNDDLGLLDQYEGEGSSYGRFQTTIETSIGSVGGVWVYEVLNRGGPFHPSREYMQIMRKAASEFGFPEEYLVSIDVSA
jgi:gamma-glutamylcyclotransferase (GGCT)/AIG2-like uncharacterized protein YtfP